MEKEEIMTAPPINTLICPSSFYILDSTTPMNFFSAIAEDRNWTLSSDEYKKHIIPLKNQTSIHRHGSLGHTTISEDVKGKVDPI